MIDLGHAGVVADVVELHASLVARNVHLSDVRPVDDVQVDSDDPFVEQLPTVVVANCARRDR